MKKNSLVHVSLVKAAVTAAFLLPTISSAEGYSAVDQIGTELNSLSKIGQSGQPGTSSANGGQNGQVNDWYTQLSKVYGPTIEKLKMYDNWNKSASKLQSDGAKAVSNKADALLGKAESDIKAANGIPTGMAAAQSNAVAAPLDNAQVAKECKIGVDSQGPKSVLTALDSMASTARQETADINKDLKKKLDAQAEAARQKALVTAIPQLNEFMEMAKKIPGIAAKLTNVDEAGKVLNFAVEQVKKNFENDVSKQTILAMVGPGGVFEQLDKLEALQGDLGEVKQNLAAMIQKQGQDGAASIMNPAVAAEANCLKQKKQIISAGKNIVAGIKAEEGIEGGFSRGAGDAEQTKFRQMADVTCDASNAKLRAGDVQTVASTEAQNIMRATSVRGLRSAVMTALGSIPQAMMQATTAVAAFNQNECDPLAKAMESIKGDSERSALASGQSKGPQSAGAPRGQGRQGGNQVAAVPPRAGHSSSAR